MIRILLIEDDPRVQQIESRYLLRVFAGASLWCVDNAAAAIDLIASAPKLDLIVSDFDLRYSTGGDVLAWVRANEPALLARFVFLSGRIDLEQLHDKVIDKLDIRQLGDKLRELVPSLFATAVAA